MARPLRILGVDPGLRLTGYGVIDWTGDVGRPALVDAGVIRLDAGTPVADRLVALEASLVEVIDEHRPAVVAVEKLFSHYGHPLTAILMGHARGVILLAARRAGARLEEYAAKRVKQSLTGTGAAGKAQVQRAIQHLWDLPTPPEPPDVADALAIALCCGRALGSSTLPR